ncbi:YhdP family protein [Marinobacter sp. GN3S48]|uniref:YhdP family phospholipid transporter n=1 Tax=Marinobacter sp. GN3S48 TaxID=3382302 RepID=UPI00387AADE1
MSSMIDDQDPESTPVRLASRLASLVWWSLLVALVLLALFAGVGRQLTQNIDSFRDDIEARLSQELGHEISIGSLRSGWTWLDPSLEARDLVVKSEDGSEVAASLQHLRIRLDTLSSLFRFRIVFGEFEADGLALTLNQTPRGAVSVEGADLPEPVTNDLKLWLDRAGDWLSDPSVKITRVSLGIRDNNDKIRHLDIPQLDLVYHRGLFKASGRAMQAGTTEQLASFSLLGQHFFRGDFNGQLYVDVNSGRLFDGLVDEYSWRNIRVEGFDLGGHAWLTFREGRLEQVTGTVETPYLQLGVDRESLAPLEDIRSRFGWRRSETALTEDEPVDLETLAGDGELHLNDLEWTWDGDQVSPFNLRVIRREEGLDIIADEVPLRPLRRVVSSIGLLPAVARQALDNYRPGGRLDDLRVQVPGQDGEGFELFGMLDDVSVEAYRGVPEVRGLNGRIVMDHRRGYVVADSESATLGFPLLFRDNWMMTSLGARVAWQMEGPITRVWSDDIRVNYGENTELTGAFDLRMDREGEDNLSLQVGVKNGKADMLAEFVPVHVVDPGLYEWLTTAITDADITEGVYYGHGLINRDAPPGSFVSSMRYRFDNASVRYDERWPAVENGRGEVFIHNGQTRVELEQGTTGQLQLERGQVRVEPVDDRLRLSVDASAAVPGAAVSYWMENSPLGEMAGAAGRSISVGGDYQLDLGLQMPLDGNGEPDLEARVATQNGQVAYPEADLVWEQLSGELGFSNTSGFSGEPLKAVFLGDPVTVSLSRNDSSGAMTIQQRGRISLPQAFTRAGLESDVGLGLEGETDYTATLDVSPETASTVTIRSNLEGVSVDWPEPLAKTVDEGAPLSVTIDPAREGGLGIAVTWENRLSFDLLRKSSGFDLDIERLWLGRQLLTDIEVVASDLGDQWVINTRSDRAVGRVVLPDGDEPITADVQSLHLTRDGGTEPDQRELLTVDEQLEAFRALEIGEWPDINVSIARLRLNDDELGRWAFRLRPEPFRLKVEGIEGQLNSLKLAGDMTWSIAGDREMTRFAGNIEGGTLGDLGNLFDADIPLRNEETAIQLDLDWPGRPNEFGFEALSGSVSLRLDDGVILERNNTAQVFRVFNLLNADTLWRRLKLDFSDLYEAGVAFDAISGKAVITDGLLSWDPELQVVGPSGAFKLSGTTDMEEETLDMRLVVVLPLTQNLPLAALLMGAGAPIGGALFVLDKILGDPLSKLTSASYSVTGSWDEPEVDLRRVFDTGE